MKRSEPMKKEKTYKGLGPNPANQFELRRAAFKCRKKQGGLFK
jgi:hypothetical protein